MKSPLYFGSLLSLALAAATGSRVCLAMSAAGGLALMAIEIASMFRFILPRIAKHEPRDSWLGNIVRLLGY